MDRGIWLAKLRVKNIRMRLTLIEFILAAYGRNSDFNVLIKAFEQEGVRIVTVDSLQKALSRIGIGGMDLFIFDETLLKEPEREFIGKVITANPMLNCVIASEKVSKVFHDTYEGMGVLMQIPMKPDKADVGRILSRLEKVMLPVKK